jgi:hypothetical protein
VSVTLRLVRLSADAELDSGASEIPVLGNFQKIGEVGEVRSTKLHLERLYPAGARPPGRAGAEVGLLSGRVNNAWRVFEGIGKGQNLHASVDARRAIASVLGYSNVRHLGSRQTDADCVQS